MMDPDLRKTLCAAWACALEINAPKFGNVHPLNEFPALKVRDFIRSTQAIASILARAPGRPIGDTILEAIQETRKVVNTNNNLGILLLLSSLAAVADDTELKEGVVIILNHLTVEDAVKSYQAIRIAEPGGLGVVQQQDIRNNPTMSLRDAMALAADRDLIARQYVNGFADVFAAVEWFAEQIKEQPPNCELEVGSSGYHVWIGNRIVSLQLWFLSQFADSLV